MLSDYLNKFWSWAEMSSKQYNHNLTPKSPNVPNIGEWEEEFPLFNSLQSAFQASVQKLIEGKQHFLNEILEAVAIDHVDGGFADYLTDKYPDKEYIIDKGINFWMRNTRWQFVMQLQQLEVINKDEILKEIALTDTDPYVRQIAISSLHELDSDYLKEVCEINIKHENQRLKEVCIKLMSSSN